jgi:hypothetical protein
VMHGREKSDPAIVCAGQRPDREGSSPSGARMRSAVSKGGGNSSLAEVEWGGMETSLGARRRKLETRKTDLEPPLAELRRTGCPPRGGSEGYAEKYRAVVEGGYPKDEPVGQRWGKVEPALWRRRRSHPPTAPRCLRTARYGRSERDPRRALGIHGWHRGK